MSRLWSLLARLLGEVIPVLLLVVVTVAIGAEIVGRTGFRRPVHGARDIGLMAFVWLVYLGLIGVARDNQMVGITYFRDRLGRARGLAVAMSHLLVMAVAAFVAYAAWRQIATARFVRFEQLPIPKWTLAVSILLGMAGVIAIHAARLWAALRGRADAAAAAPEPPAPGGGPLP